MSNIKISFESNYKCGICGEEYTTKPFYCDESIDCAFDEGKSIITL